MDQRSDDIRQDIESTRAALSEKLDTLENKTREAFDLKHHMSERPWTMFGLAVAAGYVLGSMGDSHSESYSSSSYPLATTNYTPTYTSAGTGTYTPSQTTSRSPSEQKQSAKDGFLSHFDEEIAMLKQAAITTLREFLHESIREYAPSISKHMEQSLGEPNAATSGQRASAQSTHQYSTPMAGDRDYVKTYHPPSEADRERTVGKSNENHR